MNSERPLKTPLLGKLDALCVFSAWVFLLLVFVALAYLHLAAAPDSSAFLVVIAIALFVVFGLAHFTLSFFVRCPHCNGRLTVQGWVKPKFGDWSAAAIRWFTGSVVCIHCGN